MKAVVARALPRLPRSWRPLDLQGQRVLVVGLGTFGGAVGAIRFLVSQGAQVTVTDLRDADTLAESLASLADLPGLRFVLGEHSMADVEAADFVVASPAVPFSAGVLQEAARLGRPVETEISLLFRLLPGRTLGITGTNGKSTVAMLAENALREAAPGRVYRGGNLGGSLLDRVGQMPDDAWTVLELSSFQLEHLRDLELGPEVAVVTNVTPDHLDRHGSMACYAAAKEGILGQATTAVMNRDDAACRAMASRFPGEVLWFGRDPGAEEPGFWLQGGMAVCRREQEVRVGLDDFPLLGAHNQLNLMAATAAASVFGAGFELSIRSGRSAQPLPNRLRTVCEVGGVRYVDDSVSTSPPAVAAALASVSGGIHLLIGGYDKGIDPTELLEEILTRCKQAYLFGQVAPALEAALAGRLQQRTMRSPRQGDVVRPNWSRHPDLLSAFRAASASARPGETVLLSPGYASYDQFRNFTERGQLFLRLVGALPVA